MWVDDEGQQHGMRIQAGSEDVLVHGNVTYGNREQGILDETGEAVVADNGVG